MNINTVYNNQLSEMSKTISDNLRLNENIINEAESEESLIIIELKSDNDTYVTIIDKIKELRELINSVSIDLYASYKLPGFGPW